ncbi:MAG: hypothetical protein JO172_06435 [Hyphomicrobiales bacterium]|nr:hypothetical protein [Hyphomicrobiales bacterium]
MSATRDETRARRSKRGAKAASAKAKPPRTKPIARPKAPAETAVNGNALASIVAPQPRRRRAPAAPVTREWVLERLAENVRRAMKIEPVTVRGTPTGEYRYEGSVANRALELLGKELGLLVERSESVNTHHVVSGEPITEAKWEEQYSR